MISGSNFSTNIFIISKFRIISIVNRLIQSISVKFLHCYTIIFSVLVTCLHDKAKPLVQSRQSGVLIGNVLSDSIGVRYIIGHHYLAGFVVSRVPVWYPPHSRLSVSKPLAKVSELGMGVTAPMRIVRGDVQEKVLT